ncbi:MAG: hypothetical protein M0P49_05940 [Bacilli bacterium]|nr:hypothetical protein [Bacilli bacterium]
MPDGDMISAKLVRYPIVPLSYANKNIAVPREMLIDYEYGRLYILKEDGNGYLRLLPGSEPFAGAVFTTTIGDGVNSLYTINHNLATEDVLVSIVRLNVKKNTLADYTIIDANNITINFGSTIGTNTYRVIVYVPGGGPTTFLSLKDAPSSYVGNAGKLVSIKPDESGLEYISKQDSNKFTTTIGNGVSSVYTINHNLGTEDVLVSIIKLATKKNTLADFTIVNSNSITINFGSVIGVNTYRVIVL